MNGVLVVDKPIGPSSHDIVARVRRATGGARVGHTGTLDPLASGVLPLVVGRASRLAQFLTSREKTYEAEITLGLETDTYDITGTPVAPGDGPNDRGPSREAIASALAAFRGSSEQRPPPFSAKKIGGRRAYALARRGTPVSPPPAAVTVSLLELEALDGPRLRVRLTCTAGFYVRSLAHDLGARLGTGGCLSALRRVRSGDFDIADAVTLEALDQEADTAAAIESWLIPMSRLLPGMPSVTLTGDGARRASQGNLIGPPHLKAPFPAFAGGSPRVRLLDEEGRLIAIAEPVDVDEDEPGFLHPGIVVG